jgi:hypothetical protein
MLKNWNTNVPLRFLSPLIVFLLTISLISCSDDPTDPAPSAGVQFTIYEPDDTAGWELQNGIHNPMSCLWGTGPGNVYAAGLNGSILHYSGGTEWNPHFMLPGITWRGLWGASADTVYAVGSTGSSRCCPGPYDIGVVYQCSNGQWQQVFGQERVVFVDIWGSAGDDVYAVGTDNPGVVISHFDGETWQTISDPVIEQIPSQALAVWGSSASDVFVAGDDGVIIHFNGTDWQQMDNPGETISSLWGTGATDVYACDYSGQILHYDGTEWTVQAQFEQPLMDIFGFPTGEIFISGQGTILQKTGLDWAETNISVPRFVSSQTPFEYYSAIWGTSPDHMFTVGTSNNFGIGSRNAIFMHLVGGSWQFMQTPASADIQDMWGVSENEIYAAGGLSTLLRYNGARWLPMAIPNLGTWPSADGTGVEFLSIWASGQNDIYAGTRTGIWHFDGMEWTYTQEVDGARDLWGTGPQNVFAIEHKYEGGPGPFQVMHFDGSTWTSIGELSHKPYKLHGLDNGSIVVAGDHGLCQVYDGAIWTDLDPGDSNTFFSVWGNSLENLYVGRYNSRSILHFNSIEWEDTRITTGNMTAYVILGNSPDDLYVLSDREAKFSHFDGVEWTPHFNVGLYVRDGWSGENTLFAGGRGRIFHKPVPQGVSLK